MSTRGSATAKRHLLAEYGLEPSEDGFDLDAVLDFAAQRGWRVVATPPQGTYGRGKRWRATVFGDWRDGAMPGYPGAVRGGRGHGVSEADAVAQALAGVLAAETSSGAR